MISLQPEGQLDVLKKWLEEEFVDCQPAVYYYSMSIGKLNIELSFTSLSFERCIPVVVSPSEQEWIQHVLTVG